MTKTNKRKSSRTSLRFQYIVAAVIVVVIFIVGTIFAGLYFKQATEKNAELLELHDNINVHVDAVRSEIWKADKSLYVLLSNSENIELNEIKLQFNRAGEKLKKIIQIKGVNKTGVTLNLKKLLSAYGKLNSEVVVLLELRKNINWLYPMLPFINATLLESNKEFETALDEAIKETLGEGRDKHFSKVYEDLDELKNIWRLNILSFRGAIIKFAGLNSKLINQEKNIENYYLLIDEKLKSLSRSGEKGGLGFITEVAVESMRNSSKQWYKDYNELLELKKSKVWRSDIYYIRTKIQPLQKNVFDELQLLEKNLNAWSAVNTENVNNVAKKINTELWFLTSVAILFVVLMYFKIKKSLLSPVVKIAEAISLDSGSYENMITPDDSSKEIHVLVKAFNNMRKQIHHRQMILEHQAMHDSLTGLPNRALLQDRLKQAIIQAERNSSNMSLLILDLDRFKDINDTLGHPVGDAVLRVISKRLEESVRSIDTVARLGGDEFAIITNDNDDSNVQVLINRIVKNVEKVITIEEQNLYVGLSIGIAVYPSDGEDVDTLIQHADIAMYDAKRDNKNQEFYHADKNYYSADNLTLLSDLKEELKIPSGKIQLYFQPQINVSTGDLIGLEALIRWNHPTHGFLPAEQIIRMAEQTGVISELTYWVINESINEYMSWNDSSLTISINLSVWNLQDPELIPLVDRKIKETNIKPENVSFEITESAVMNDAVNAREVLEELNSKGFELAIDDYGIGFSSLAYLKLLPVKYLKIDKSFVLDMLNDENDAIIVHSTIELAHNLGMRVVAEGVEDKDSLRRLCELGCDFAQGYYVARPIPADKVIDWLASYNYDALV